MHGKLADDRGTIDARRSDGSVRRPVKGASPPMANSDYPLPGPRALRVPTGVGATGRSGRHPRRALARDRAHPSDSGPYGHRGHPLLGDSLYGRAEEELIGRPALHARRLSLVHPIDGHRLDLTSQPPADFQRLLKRLRRVDADSEIDPGAEPVARIDPKPGDPLA